MDISEIKLARNAMNSEIADAIIKFERLAGLQVFEIEMHRIDLSTHERRFMSLERVSTKVEI